jgi:penicillin-insensitive murein endopeptidase
MQYDIGAGGSMSKTLGTTTPIFAVVAVALALLASVVAPPAYAEARSEWAAVREPSPGVPRVIGGTGLGCIGGAVALPREGPGFQAVRLSRNRNWGHPVTIAAVETLARQARGAGFPDLWIGDLGQPRGGPMPFGHASHQVGLDADVWLDLGPKPLVPGSPRETIRETSLVLPDESDVDPARFTARHATLIRMAAELPGIDRVLVNHGIKRGLCRMHGGAAWLRYVRPWRGHDSHMHIRMRCPLDQPDCRGIPPPPLGDGCDASLAWWLSDAARAPGPREAGLAPVMPGACRAVLNLRRGDLDRR